MDVKTPPTADQVLEMMKSKMGDSLPGWADLLAEQAPDLIVATGITSAQSVGRDESTIPAKYRHLIAVGAALGRAQANCARSQAQWRGRPAQPPRRFWTWSALLGTWPPRACSMRLP